MHSKLRASDFNVRLCFLVNILKARGRSAEGEISTARMRGAVGRVVVGLTATVRGGGGVGIEEGGRGTKGSEVRKPAEEEGIGACKEAEGAGG